VWMRRDELRDTEKNRQREGGRTIRRVEAEKSNSRHGNVRVIQVSAIQRLSGLGLENETKSSRVNIYHTKYMHDQSMSQDALYLLLSGYYYYCSMNDSVSALSEGLHIISHHSIYLLTNGAHIFVTV
jgi:hypothetical protein